MEFHHTLFLAPFVADAQLVVMRSLLEKMRGVEHGVKSFLEIAVDRGENWVRLSGLVLYSCREMELIETF